MANTSSATNMNGTANFLPSKGSADDRHRRFCSFFLLNLVCFKAPSRNAALTFHIYTKYITIHTTLQTALYWTYFCSCSTHYRCSRVLIFVRVYLPWHVHREENNSLFHLTFPLMNISGSCFISKSLEKYCYCPHNKQHRQHSFKKCIIQPNISF